MQWLNDGKMLPRLSSYMPAQFEVVNTSLQPRFPRNTIFDDVSEAIAKVGWRTAISLARNPDWLCWQALNCESCVMLDKGRPALQQCCF